MEKIFSEFTFDAEATQVATPLVEVLERRRGVCQDFAHLMLACVRSRGLAARYISGYLLTQPPPGQPRLIGADASHAWVSVFCPVLGWVDFDPTNNVQPALEHITLAWGRDFSDVSPLRGVILGGGNHDPEVRVTVMPLESTVGASLLAMVVNDNAARPDTQALSGSSRASSLLQEECGGISDWPVRVSKGSADPGHRSGGPDQIIGP